MFDCVVIGGGVIGLAISRHFALTGNKVALFEAQAKSGQETSFRNSAVVHAGLYYPRDSLKARLCLKGKSLLRSYCADNKVPYKAIGKLIVAVEPGQIKQLTALEQTSKRNGITNLSWLNQEEITTLEPAVAAVGALYSPETAVLNGQLFLQSLEQDFVQAGGYFFPNNKVTHCEQNSTHFVIHTKQGDLKSKLLVNAAGLWAQEVARNIKGLSADTIPCLFLAKGNYFRYLASSPFSHLIYPLPETAGLGIHATIDVYSNLRFGPDVEWVNSLDFTTNSARKAFFLQQIRTYFPGVNEEVLVPDNLYTGIRPKIKPPQEQPQDFLIQSYNDHQVKGLINLYGIESPGLTAALAIAEYVHECLLNNQVNSNNLP